MGLFEKLADAALAGIPGIVKESLPEHWIRRARARWEDVSPFAVIADRGDLRRAVRLAWIEAALEILSAARREALTPEWRDEREAIETFEMLARGVLVTARDAAFDRRTDAGTSPIDPFAHAVLEGAPERASGAEARGEAESVTWGFPAALAALTGWPEAEIPDVFAQVARRGLPIHGGGPLRPFGELVFAAFADLVKDPGKYPQAAAEFRTEMAAMAIDLSRAVLDAVGALDARFAERAPEQVLRDGLAAQLEEIRADNWRWLGLSFLNSGRVDLSEAWTRIQARPTELLIARYQVVPFLDRGGLLEGLLDWALDTTGGRARGRLYTAPGGAGKTRLGIELLATLEARGWRCSFLSRTNTRELAPGTLTELLRPEQAAGTCLVVDYAESQIELLHALADAAFAEGRSAGPPIRILALARSALGWWNGFASDTGPSLVFDPTPLENVAGALGPDDRASLFALARDAFGETLIAFGLETDEAGAVPSLAAVAYGRPLAVVAAAYLAARGLDPAADNLFETLYREERRHWRRALGAVADDAPAVAELGRIAAQVTLVQGASEDGVRALLEADDVERAVGAPDLVRVLRRLYGRVLPGPNGDGESALIAPIEPDVLGEHIAMRVSAHDGCALVVATMDRALEGPPLHPIDPREILTVLTRSTRPEHDPRVRVAAERVATALGTLGEGLDRDRARRLAGALPVHSVVLRGLSAAVAERLAAFPAGDESDEELSARAGALNNLGNRLSRLGRREDALAASAEAVEIYRDLVAKNPDTFLPDLALCLCARGSVLADAERPEDAAAHFREGVSLYDSVADQAPDEIGRGIELALPDLVRALEAAGASEGEVRDRLSEMGIAPDDNRG